MMDDERDNGEHDSLKQIIQIEYLNGIEKVIPKKTQFVRYTDVLYFNNIEKIVLLDCESRISVYKYSKERERNDKFILIKRFEDRKGEVMVKWDEYSEVLIVVSSSSHLESIDGLYKFDLETLNFQMVAKTKPSHILKLNDTQFINLNSIPPTYQVWSKIGGEWKSLPTSKIDLIGSYNRIEDHVKPVLSKKRRNCFYVVIWGKEGKTNEEVYGLFFIDPFKKKNLFSKSLGSKFSSFSIYFDRNSLVEYIIVVCSDSRFQARYFMMNSETLNNDRVIDIGVPEMSDYMCSSLYEMLIVGEKYLALGGEIDFGSPYGTMTTACVHIYDLETMRVLGENFYIGSPNPHQKGIIRNISLHSVGRNWVCFFFTSNYSGDADLVRIMGHERGNLLFDDTPRISDSIIRVRFIMKNLEDFIDSSCFFSIQFPAEFRFLAMSKVFLLI